MFCTRTRPCAGADDAKIVRSRNAHAKLGKHLKSNRVLAAWYNHRPVKNSPYYYTTKLVQRADIKISQSDCSVAGPIFSKYWAGHCPE